MHIGSVQSTTRENAGSVAELAREGTPVARSRQPMTPAALRKAAPEVQRAEVAAQFEAILVRQLLAPTMTSMLGSDNGASAAVYGDMLTDTLAQQLTRGSGLGLGQLLQQQLSPRAPVAPSTSQPL